MAQHFLLSAQARTLSVIDICQMSDDAAYDAFKAIRFAETNGEPFCPACGCAVAYEIAAKRKTKDGQAKRPMFKCADCLKQFTLTSGTIFASRKLPYRTILAAIAIFVNGVKSHAALHLSRDLNVQYKTAYVLGMKLREVFGAELKAEATKAVLSGEVEIDGAYFGGKLRKANLVKDRTDRRSDRRRTEKTQVVVVARERNGRTRTFVTKSEAEGVPLIVKNVDPTATVYADEGAWWNALHGRFLTKRIDHTNTGFSDDGASTNWAESFFARFKRSQFGIHHRVAGKHLHAYASDITWRENYRRVSNGEQYLVLAHGATHHPVSREWKGYWQRRKAV